MKHGLLYNLQYFGDGSSNTSSSDTDNSDNNNAENSVSNGQDGQGDVAGGEGTVDTSAFADIISDKDKKIEQIEAELKQLKKANADLLLKVNTGNKTEQTFEESLLNLVGYKPGKE